MARSNNNLNAVLQDTANAIKAKKEDQTPVCPRDFADEIANLPSGPTPTGTMYIHEEDTYDVADYAFAKVCVKRPYLACATVDRYTTINDEGIDTVSTLIQRLPQGVIFVSESYSSSFPLYCEVDDNNIGNYNIEVSYNYHKVQVGEEDYQDYTMASVNIDGEVFSGEYSTIDSDELGVCLGIVVKPGTVVRINSFTVPIGKSPSMSLVQASDCFKQTIHYIKLYDLTGRCIATLNSRDVTVVLVEPEGSASNNNGEYSY